MSGRTSFHFWKRLGQVRTEVAEKSIWDLANVYCEGKVAGLSIITLAKCSTLFFVLWCKITCAFHSLSLKSILHDNVSCCWVAGNENKKVHFILKLSRGWTLKDLLRNKLRFTWGLAEVLANVLYCSNIELGGLLSSSLGPYYVYARPQVKYTYTELQKIPS